MNESLRARNADIERLFLAGMSYGRIARELSITPGAVAGTCWRIGLTPDEREGDHQTLRPKLTREQRLAGRQLRAVREAIERAEERVSALRRRAKRLLSESLPT